MRILSEEIVKIDREELRHLIETAIFEAIGLYHNAQIERGMMPGVAKRLAVEEAMERVEERVGEVESGAA